MPPDENSDNSSPGLTYGVRLILHYSGGDTEITAAFVSKMRGLSFDRCADSLLTGSGRKKGEGGVFHH